MVSKQISARLDQRLSINGRLFELSSWASQCVCEIRKWCACYRNHTKRPRNLAAAKARTRRAVSSEEAALDLSKQKAVFGCNRLACLNRITRIVESIESPSKFTCRVRIAGRFLRIQHPTNDFSLHSRMWFGRIRFDFVRRQDSVRDETRSFDNEATFWFGPTLGRVVRGDRARNGFDDGGFCRTNDFERLNNKSAKNWTNQIDWTRKHRSIGLNRQIRTT